MRIKWNRIDAGTYMEGVYATKEDRKAEVARVYAGQWTTFYYVNGEQLRVGFNPPDVTFMEARSNAALFLNTGKIRLFNR